MGAGQQPTQPSLWLLHLEVGQGPKLPLESELWLSLVAPIMAVKEAALEAFG